MKITFLGVPNQRQPGYLHWFAGSQCLSPARSGEATSRPHLTGQLLICIVMPRAQMKAKLDGETKQKHLVHSRQQDAIVSILRTANYLDRFCAPMFDQHGITSQQFNVLRILRGAGLGGLPTLDIAERMIEQAPGITRLLDRLEGKKLVRRERPADNRRQVLCYITKPPQTAPESVCARGGSPADGSQSVGGEKASR